VDVQVVGVEVAQRAGLRAPQPHILDLDEHGQIVLEVRPHVEPRPHGCEALGASVRQLQRIPELESGPHLAAEFQVHILRDGRRGKRGQQQGESHTLPGDHGTSGSRWQVT
jgi:hypothetical protein